MDQRLMNIRTPHHAKCLWLFERKEFKDWCDESKVIEHHGFLWIKGKPGCGKSAIMKTALLRAELKRPPKPTLSYFFNARAMDSSEKSSLGMYRSLVHQLLSGIPEYREQFVKQFRRKVGHNQVVNEWTIAELQNYILFAVKNLQGRPLTVYIDALDGGEEDDIRSMITFPQEVGYVSMSRGESVKVCLSSRHYPHISIRNGVSIIIENLSEYDQDINKYVDYNLVGNKGTQRDNIKSNIHRKASGVFLWVILVIPMLNKLYDKDSESAMLNRLQDIPAELNGLFREILGKDPSTRNRSVLTLQWMLFSYTPLSPIELFLEVKVGCCPPQEIDLELPC